MKNTPITSQIYPIVEVTVHGKNKDYVVKVSYNCVSLTHSVLVTRTDDKSIFVQYTALTREQTVRAIDTLPTFGILSLREVQELSISFMNKPQTDINS